MIKDKQYEQLMKEIRGISSHLVDIDNGMEKEAQERGDLAIEVATMKAQLEEVRKGQRTSAEKIGESVADAVAPIVEVAENLTIAVEDKSTRMTIREKFSIGKMLDSWKWW